MAAVILAPHPTHPTPRRRALRLVASPDHERRPAIRPAIHPAPRPVTLAPRCRPTPATYWRRRFVVLLALTSLAVAVNLAASTLLDPSDELSVVTAPVATSPVVTEITPAAPSAAPAEPAVYVVRPGDTMWSIAAKLQPGADVRDLVDQLTERAGGAGVQAGQRIALDGLGL